jgi:hypothetical protein
VNPAAHDDTAFGEHAKRCRDERADRCKNHRGIQFFRRNFIGTADPHRAKFFRGLLCCIVARPSEHEEFAPFVECNLPDQMRGVAETINAKAPRIPRFAIGSVTDQSGAKQRRNLDVIVTLRQMETVARVRDGELGITAIDRVTGKPRVIAKILSTGSAIRAIAIGPAKPRDPHAIADCEDGSGLGAAIVGTLRSLPHFAYLFDFSDNLVTENQWQLRIGQFAIDHVKVSATNRAGVDSHEQLSPTRLRLRHIAQLQGLFRPVENHRAHG